MDLALDLVPVAPVAQKPPETAAASAKPKPRANPMKQRQLQEQRTTLEASSAQLEAKISELEGSLAHFVNPEETRRLAAEIEQRRADLERTLQQWEEVSVALEQMA